MWEFEFGKKYRLNLCFVLSFFGFFLVKFVEIKLWFFYVEIIIINLCVLLVIFIKVMGCLILLN